MKNSAPLFVKLGRMAAVAALFASSASMAGEGAFGWVYSLDLQPKGTMEFEQKFDVTHGQAVGDYSFGLFRSELEYGVTNDFQVAGYINAATIRAHDNYLDPDVCAGASIPCTAGFGVPTPHNNNRRYSLTEIDGGSVEAIWRITNPVTSPVGVGLYIEPTWGRLENELELRALFQSNFLDDRLVLVANLLYEMEKEKYAQDGVILNSMGDLLYGASYRFAPGWSGGIEGRYHTDHDGYWFNTKTQSARFVGPNLHYAAEKWWVTAAWRHQIGGTCFNDGTADCSVGHVWDNHGRNEYAVKIGYQFN